MSMSCKNPSFLLRREVHAYTHSSRYSMGTEGGGNDFPGAARPFGMVKLGPDLFKSGSDAYSGYLPDGRFSGFSMMHEQGTGGAPKYGTVSQLPLVGDIGDPLSNITVPRTGTDEGSVGYYKAQTGDGVTVELSASSRAGIYRYKFPAGTKNHVLVDVSHVLPSFRGQGLGQSYKGGKLTVFDDGHYEGSGVYDNGWNEAPDWTIYFCELCGISGNNSISNYNSGGYFDSKIISNKTYTATGAAKSIEESSGSVSSSSGSSRVGGLFSFRDREVTSRVGISWISRKKACNNVNREIPKDTSLDSVVDDAVSEWNGKVLSKITTTNTNETSLGLLYTSLYFMHLIPTDQTGENPGWASSEPYYQDIFTFWVSRLRVNEAEPFAQQSRIYSVVLLP